MQTSQPSIWNRCIQALKADLSEQQINMYLRPLQPLEDAESLRLLAPNRFIVDWINANCRKTIDKVIDGNTDWPADAFSIEVGHKPETPVITLEKTSSTAAPEQEPVPGGALNPAYTFANYVEGKSNQLARAAAYQVGQNPGLSYNPLFIVGGVGLGKTQTSKDTAVRGERVEFAAISALVRIAADEDQRQGVL